MATPNTYDCIYMLQTAQAAMERLKTMQDVSPQIRRYLDIIDERVDVVAAALVTKQLEAK